MFQSKIQLDLRTCGSLLFTNSFENRQGPDLRIKLYRASNKEAIHIDMGDTVAIIAHGVGSLTIGVDILA